MWRFFYPALLIIGLWGGVLQHPTHSQMAKVKAQAITIHLSQPKDVYPAGASIPLTASITNRGNQILIMCRDLGPSSHLCFWEFQARDESGNAMPALRGAGDSVPSPPSSFANSLISNWIALAPHYTYATTIDAQSALGSNPRPGLYSIRAVLSSDGPNARSEYNDLLHYPEKLASLPYQGWRGSTKSNWVSVRIIQAR